MLFEERLNAYLEIVAIDEDAAIGYFEAAGREDGEDSYDHHLYRVNLDGSGLRLLNPVDLDHRVEMGEVAQFFSTRSYETGLAQFGFIVVTVGNRGGHPARSKWYHNYGYGNLRDYGLEDKEATIEQLADRHDYIDPDRVGIYGHSGGGFMSTAAMLIYPDFFKVAVSSSGNIAPPPRSAAAQRGPPTPPSSGPSPRPRD